MKYKKQMIGLLIICFLVFIRSILVEFRNIKQFLYFHIKGIGNLVYALEGDIFSARSIWPI